VDLASFERGVAHGGSNDGQAVFTEQIDNARYQGRFGSHDGQIHAEVFRQCDIIHGRLRTGVAGSDRGQAGIAGRRMNFGDRRRAAQPPGEGMFTAAAADN